MERKCHAIDGKDSKFCQVEKANTEKQWKNYTFIVLCIARYLKNTYFCSAVLE